MTKNRYIHPHNLKAKCTFPLSPVDCLQAAIPPIAFSIFYDQSVDVVKLQAALEQALIAFPILAGRIHRTSNRKQAPFQVHVHPLKGGALFTTAQIAKPYPTKEDRRWFPLFTGNPWPCPHEPNFTYGPLLKVKVTHVASTNSSVVSFGFCHAVMDATTIGAFLETLQVEYNHGSDSCADPPMSLERVLHPKLPEGSKAPLDRFTPSTLLKAIPKILKRVQHVNLTVETSELQRLKADFVKALEGELEWVSTYEMLGAILLKAFYKASEKELIGNSAIADIECRCVVDPRNRSANPHVNSSHPGNVAEMPSIRLPFDTLSGDAWKKHCLSSFHSQLRSTLEDPEQMTYILQRAHTSSEKGYLHTKEGRVFSSKIFARNMTEANVCSYNSWLHMNWFDMTTLGNANALHFQVAPGLNCPDMFWVFPRTPTQVTIRTTMTPGKAKRFLEELRDLNLAFEVQ